MNTTQKTLTTSDEINSLPVGAIFRDNEGEAYLVEERDGEGVILRSTFDEAEVCAEHPQLPATLLFVNN